MAAKWQQWMPFHIDKFRGSPAVQAMPPAARAGYLYLLCAQWQSDDSTIPSDEESLADLSGLGDELWAKHRERILRSFGRGPDDALTNLKCKAEWDEAKRIFESRQQAASRTNESRSPRGHRKDSEWEPLRSADTITETLTITTTDTKTKTKAASAFELPDWVPEKQWVAYEEMRRKVRKPMTDHARDLAVRKLDELRRLGNSPAAVLEQSILNDWQGLFEIKGSSNGHKPVHPDRYKREPLF